MKGRHTCPLSWLFVFMSFYVRVTHTSFPRPTTTCRKQLEGAPWTGQEIHNHLGDLLQAHYSFGFWGQSKWAQMALHLGHPALECWCPILLAEISQYIQGWHIPTVFVSISSAYTPVQVHVLCDLCDLCFRWAAVSSQALISKPEIKLNVAGLERQSPGNWPGWH